MLVSSVFAGGAQETAATGDKTVTMFQLKVEIKDALDGYAAQYSAATPGVTVEVETLGGGADFGGALKAKAQAGDMPDIFQIERTRRIQCMERLYRQHGGRTLG